MRSSSRSTTATAPASRRSAAEAAPVATASTMAAATAASTSQRESPTHQQSSGRVFRRSAAASRRSGSGLAARPRGRRRPAAPSLDEGRRPRPGPGPGARRSPPPTGSREPRGHRGTRRHPAMAGIGVQLPVPLSRSAIDGLRLVRAEGAVLFVRQRALRSHFPSEPMRDATWSRIGRQAELGERLHPRLDPRRDGVHQRPIEVADHRRRRGEDRGELSGHRSTIAAACRPSSDPVGRSTPRWSS